MSTAIEGYPAFWKIYAVVLLVVCLVSCLGFLVRYTIKAQWWLTEEGRHLASLSGAIFLFMLFYVMALIFPDFPGKDGIRLGIFTFFTSVIVWRWVLFERTYFRK